MFPSAASTLVLVQHLVLLLLHSGENVAFIVVIVVAVHAFFAEHLLCLAVILAHLRHQSSPLRLCSYSLLHVAERVILPHPICGTANERRCAFLLHCTALLLLLMLQYVSGIKIRLIGLRALI
jgi:hypothetical protein